MPVGLTLMKGVRGHLAGTQKRRALETEDAWRMFERRRQMEEEERQRRLQEVQLEQALFGLTHAREMAPLETEEARGKLASRWVDVPTLEKLGLSKTLKISWPDLRDYLQDADRDRVTPYQHANLLLDAIRSGAIAEPTTPEQMLMPPPRQPGALLGEPRVIPPQYAAGTRMMEVPGYAPIPLRPKPELPMLNQAAAMADLAQAVGGGLITPEAAMGMAQLVAPDLLPAAVGRAAAIPTIPSMATPAAPTPGAIPWAEGGAVPAPAGAPAGSPFIGRQEKPMTPPERARTAAGMRTDIRAAYQGGATDFDTVEARRALWDLEHPTQKGAMPAGWGRSPAIKPSQQEQLEISGLRAAIAQQNANTNAARAAASASRSGQQQVRWSTLTAQDDRLRDDQDRVLKELETGVGPKDRYGRPQPLSSLRRHELWDRAAELDAKRQLIFRQITALGIPAVRPTRPVGLQPGAAKPDVPRFSPTKEIELGATLEAYKRKRGHYPSEVAFVKALPHYNPESLRVLYRKHMKRR